MKSLKGLWLIILIASFLTSCMDDDSLWEMNRSKYSSYSDGVFIVNEGNFWYNNASLSFYEPETKSVKNNIFFDTNGLPLGDVAQSMTIRDSLGYIVINNSGRIYIIDINNFTLKGKITQLTSPRHIHFINDTKAYVSDLYGQAITIVNPLTMKITGSIDIHNPGGIFNQHSSDKMVQYGKYIFTNSWSYDNTILVIDSETDSITSKIKVNVQPQSIAIDKHGKLWVLCDGGYKGNPFGYEAPSLLRIDAATHQVEKTFTFNIDDSPRSLAMNGSSDTLYYLNRHLYMHSVISNAEPSVYIQSNHTNPSAGGFYGLAIDPVSSDIYIADAIDNVQQGLVYRFRSDAMPLDTLRVGIIPGTFCFKN